MLHISFSNLLLLTVSRSSMYLIVSLNFLATHKFFHSLVVLYHQLQLVSVQSKVQGSFRLVSPSPISSFATKSRQHLYQEQT